MSRVLTLAGFKRGISLPSLFTFLFSASIEIFLSQVFSLSRIHNLQSSLKAREFEWVCILLSCSSSLSFSALMDSNIWVKENSFKLINDWVCRSKSSTHYMLCTLDALLYVWQTVTRLKYGCAVLSSKGPSPEFLTSPTAAVHLGGGPWWHL